MGKGVMLKTNVLGLALLLAMSGPLHAGETIDADKLSQADLRSAIEAAPDDAIISFRGQTKTKAQLRSAWQAAHKPPDVAKNRAGLAALRAAEAAEAQAADDKRSSEIAAENAKVDAEFEALKVR
jgi:uncharacterized protein (DUF1800 family)